MIYASIGYYMPVAAVLNLVGVLVLKVRNIFYRHKTIYLIRDE